MAILPKTILCKEQLQTLSSIIQVGEACYRDMIAEHAISGHRYDEYLISRARTLFVQLQCELCSREPTFPFNVVQQSIHSKLKVTEFHTDNLILHFARSSSPNKLPNETKYRKLLSKNNSSLIIQREANYYKSHLESSLPLFGILTFGGKETLFMVILFPYPGYREIAERIEIPIVSFDELSSSGVEFERKKALLKEEFVKRYINQEVI